MPIALLDLLDPSNRTAFRDAYLDVPFDLSAHPMDHDGDRRRRRFPRRCGTWLHVVDLPAYTEQEKLAIAREHLLTRPFDGPPPTSAGVLALEHADSVAYRWAPRRRRVRLLRSWSRIEWSLPSRSCERCRRGALVARDVAGEPWRYRGVPRRRPFRAGGHPAGDSGLHQ